MVTIRLPVTEGNTQWSSKDYCQSKTSWALSIIFLMDPVNYSPLGPRYSSSSWTLSIILLLDLVIHLPHGLCQSSSSWTLSIIFLIDLVNHPPHGACQSSSSWTLSIIFLVKSEAWIKCLRLSPLWHSDKPSSGWGFTKMIQQHWERWETCVQSQGVYFEGN